MMVLIKSLHRCRSLLLLLLLAVKLASVTTLQQQRYRLSSPRPNGHATFPTTTPFFSSTHEQHRMTQRILLQQQQQHPPLLSQSPTLQRSSTSLRMFLPPGGDGNPNSSELKQVTSTILTFVAIILFFLSPLGSIFFAVFNSLVAFLILAPLAAVAAFNIWEYVNTLSGTCPNCQAPVTVLKNEVPTICYNCGAIVQAKEGQIYLASQNKNIYSTNDVDDLLPMNRNMFTTIVEELTTVFTGTPSSDDDDDDPLDISNTTPRSASSSSSSSKNRSNQQNTIIDVKVVNDD